MSAWWQRARARLREARLREAARFYASCLSVGDEILFDQDVVTIAPFQVYLPAALAARHMSMDPTERGWRIVSSTWDDVTAEMQTAPPAVHPTIPEPGVCVAVCNVCGRSWMGSMECPHGVGKSIVVRWGRA